MTEGTILFYAVQTTETLKKMIPLLEKDGRYPQVVDYIKFLLKERG